jgi:hypothetical protein
MSFKEQAMPTFSYARAKAAKRWVATGLPALFFAGIALVFAGTAAGLTLAASPAFAAGTALYAYAGGRAVLPSNCPITSTASKECTLGEALSLAVAGNTVALATPGSVEHYVGNWTVRTPFTSFSKPLTIEAAPGVTNPTLDGNHGKLPGCGTVVCHGPVLTILSGLHVRTDRLTFRNADNTVTNFGGAIENEGGGTLTVLASAFSDNAATNGGAIDNGDNHGAGTLSVEGSTFSYNSAIGAKTGTGNGGAIDNGDNGGSGTLSVSGSRFSGNSAKGSTKGTGDGGAIDNGDNGGSGTLSVSSSTFSRNSATGTQRGTGGGGAIDNGDNHGAGTLSVSSSTFLGNKANYGGAIANATVSASVSGSTFSANSAGYGGAIADGVSGIAALSVSGSTFTQNSASANGGAIDNGDGISFRGALTVTVSTFSGNSATGSGRAVGVIALAHRGDGGAIDNADNEGDGTLTVTASTFSGNTARNGGDTIANFFTVWASADIFNGPCHESVGGIWNDEGYNVGAGTTCLSAGTGDISHGADRLGPLAHDGGPTETLLPLKGNPAIGAVPYHATVVLNGRSVALCPAKDQRGTPSASGQRCNAGAVQ